MPSSVVESWLRTISFSLCATLAEAKYPFSSGPKAKLADDTSVSFDPLGVAAVLSNPRADASAAKLYVQYDKDTFHWPHTSMIGGTLPAMQMLVEYFTSGLPSKSLSPPIKMCAKATTMIPVRSNSVFRELPLDFGNVWLNHLIAFKSGERNPGNDFMVIYIDGILKLDGKPAERTKDNQRRLGEDLGTGWLVVGRLSLYFLDLVNGAMILASMLIGILAADVWAFTLFFFYGSYWISSALITFLPMVQVFTPPIFEEKSPLYAVYERPEGGTVIFKGRKDNMEAWARTTWKYEPTWVQTTLHWSWMITGSLAAFSSVACMVNMHGYLQLAFLAVLVFATVAEIVATKISRVLQIKAKGPVPCALLTKNDKRTQGIISATIAIQSLCRLEGLDWMQMGLLPNMPVFSHMQATLAEINEIQREVEEPNMTIEEDALRAKMEICYGEYRQKVWDEVGKLGEEAQKDENDKAARWETDRLAERLQEEMRNAVEIWIQHVTGKVTPNALVKQ
ncbi:uncharacterized protein ASPGLDRAFT_50060 [Aspergillus glaucus CBS 516.65]|uniref:Uncharacterized protein n=1 Tax=Aspergillus glaucus CBS 516.65 TaxID=1160497 RepID=A0A1L9VCD3_ASPGL|nr:hypothetical protein ASPGLDRAFT_50060 [Aspergillus glaucus CBS 516.65]OJJ81535.1 hypothetical protein ASPGLDRAFT_50060 [Aspergillus glaucus CBS 516.65]